MTVIARSIATKQSYDLHNGRARWHAPTELFILSFLLFVVASFGEMLPVIGRGDVREFRRPDPWRPMFSERNLLGLSRPAPWALPRPERDAKTDSLRVLVIRVEFQPDSVSRTTGDGTFDLSPRTDAPHPFDPPPHNKAYFNSHMEALRRYYLAVSDSQLYIEWEIYPENETLAYRLPDSMGYYGELGWMSDDILDRMQQFFKDAWELAIASGDFDVADYDVYIVFHAGSDWQNDAASFIDPQYIEIWPDIFIPSPDDLPTGYLKLPFTVGGVITDGIIMPEYAWQDGQVACINGALAHEFGHQLGLVDLYSTMNFITQVGDFSLMDNGFAVGAVIPVDFDSSGEVEEDEEYPVYGMFPGYPSAWERAYLGWETPLTITSSTDSIVVQACEIPINDKPTIVKIPINSYEYFLIENRQDSLALDSEYSECCFYALDRDETTGVILGAWARDTMQYSTFYDFLLPGSGLLIWHIDELVAYGDVDGNGINNWNDNTLQWDVFRKFIALEEADGYEDLGTIVTYGEREDYFFFPNNRHFGPGTNPSSDGNDGGKTGIEVSRIDYTKAEMEFDIGLSSDVPTPNIKITIYPLYAPLVAADLDGDGIDELLTEGYVLERGSYYGCVLIWDAYGNPFIQNGYTAEGTEFDGSLVSVPYPVATIVASERITLPAVGDIDGDGYADIVGIDIDGKLHAFSPWDIGSGGMLNELGNFPVALFSSASRPVSLWDYDNDGDDEIICFGDEEWAVVNGDGSVVISGDARGEITGVAPAEDGLFILAARYDAKLFYYNWSGDLVWETQFPDGDVSYLVRADLDGDGVPMEVACAARSGKIFAFDSEGNELNYFPADVEDTSLSSPVAADHDGDGVIELMLAGEGGFYVFEPSGFIHENGPYEVENILSSPIFTGQEAILPSSDGIVIGIDKNGDSPDCFPLNGAPSDATPCLFRDPEGGVGLALGSNDGSILIWHGLMDELGDGAWPMWGADARHTFLQPASAESLIAGAELTISSFYCYPNPAERFTNFRYEVESPSGAAEITIDIFDAAGNRIAQLPGPGKAGTPMETEWHTENVASGIYWAKLSAQSGGKETSKMFRVAIVK